MRTIERSELRNFKEVRLVGENKQADIVPILEAWRRAEETGLDLVLVSPDEVVPPVVRIEDFKKIMFEKKKAKAKQQTAKRKSDLKEIQLKANISEHDLQTKVNNIDKFLTRGDKVKIVVRLKGREREHPQRAFDLLDKVAGAVTAGCKITKIPGPIATAVLEPASTK